MDGEGLSPFFGIESAPSLKLTGNEAFQDARLAKVEVLPDEECYDDMHGAPSVPRLFWRLCLFTGCILGMLDVERWSCAFTSVQACECSAS